MAATRRDFLGLSLLGVATAVVGCGTAEGGGAETKTLRYQGSVGAVTLPELAQDLGDRITHVHLGDSFGSFMDEHLVPGRGSQRCAEVLGHLVETSFGGVVTLEVGTRKLRTAPREEALAESLAFAREHLGQHDRPGARVSG